MNTLVFDTNGKCLYSINYEVTPEAYPEAGKVLHVDMDFDANDVWFDFEKNRMEHRTPFEEVVETNAIHNLPVGTEAEVMGMTVTVDDGSIEIDSMFDTSITVTLSHVRHYMKRVEVICEAQG